MATLRDVRSELANVLAQLDGDSPTWEQWHRARDAIRRAQQQLDAMIPPGEEWTVEEILAREG